MRAVSSPFAPPRDRHSCASACRGVTCWVAGSPSGSGWAQAANSRFYGTSDDLFSWSDLALLRYISASAFPRQQYASVLDIDLPGVDANHVHVGPSPWLHYTRFNADTTSCDSA